MPKLNEVFVPGGLPEVTYVSREPLHLERSVNDFLEERHRVLSLSGPTKSGKTVLIRRLVPDALLVSGGDVRSVADFWASVVDELGAFQQETKEVRKDESSRQSRGGEAGVSMVGRATVGTSAESAAGETRVHQATRLRSDRLVAQEELRAHEDVVIVVDDFHYVSSAVQLEVIRGLKQLVFDGLRVIIASVPHRAFDAVRIENEMTGRVEHLEIPIWREAELQGIATKGFTALNVATDEGSVIRLARESFGSPHLMQDFCLQFCKVGAILETGDDRRTMQAPPWDTFFRGRATNASKMAFDLLAKGPPRTDRIERQLRDGSRTDIYGAVLAAIAHTGPKTAIDLTSLRGALQDVLSDDPPQRHEVTRVLIAMTKIARSLPGEPVVDYDETYASLHISDPFFAFYLRWGAGYTGVPDQL